MVHQVMNYFRVYIPKLLYANLLTINLQLYLNFSEEMLKHKLITKSFSHRDNRTNQEREDKRNRSCSYDNSDQDSQGELQELDFSFYHNSGEQNQSIEAFIDNLQAQKSSYFEQESPEYEEIDLNATYYNSSSYSLQRINAQYMKKMNESSERRVGKGVSIKFDETVRVKFFNDSQPVAEIFKAQQFNITYHQYQQTSDEERLL